MVRGSFRRRILHRSVRSLETDSWKKQFDGGTTLILVAEDEAGVFGFVSGEALREPILGYDAELYAIYLLQSTPQPIQKLQDRAGSCGNSRLHHQLAALLSNRSKSG